MFSRRLGYLLEVLINHGSEKQLNPPLRVCQHRLFVGPFGRKSTDVGEYKAEGRDPRGPVCGLDAMQALNGKLGGAYSSENGANAGIASSVAKRGRKDIVHNSDYISHRLWSLSGDVLILFSARRESAHIKGISPHVRLADLHAEV